MVTYERLPQKVAANLFDVPKFQKSRFLKDFLLLNPTLLLHLLLPMQRNYLACLAACRNIEFSIIDITSVFKFGFTKLSLGQKLGWVSKNMDLPTVRSASILVCRLNAKLFEQLY